MIVISFVCKIVNFGMTAECKSKDKDDIRWVHYFQICEIDMNPTFLAASSHKESVIHQGNS